MSLSKYRKTVRELLSQYELARSSVKQEKAQLIRAQQAAFDAEFSRQLVQETAQLVQESAHKHISGIVTRCLRAIFADDSYEFRILFEPRRGKTEARIVFLKEGLEIDPLDGSGGGVVDVAAFALRIAAIQFSRPKLRRLIIMDEPFKFVSEEYRPRVRELLETLAKELEFQIVMVTHMDELRTGKVIQL